MWKVTTIRLSEDFILYPICVQDKLVWMFNANEKLYYKEKYFHMDEFYFDFSDLYVNLMVLFSFVNAKVSWIIFKTFLLYKT